MIRTKGAFFPSYLAIVSVLSVAACGAPPPEPSEHSPVRGRGPECSALCRDVCGDESSCLTACRAEPCDEERAADCRVLCLVGETVDVECAADCMTD